MTAAEALTRLELNSVSVGGNDLVRVNCAIAMLKTFEPRTKLSKELSATVNRFSRMQDDHSVWTGDLLAGIAAMRRPAEPRKKKGFSFSSARGEILAKMDDVLSDWEYRSFDDKSSPFSAELFAALGGARKKLAAIRIERSDARVESLYGKLCDRLAAVDGSYSARDMELVAKPAIADIAELCAAWEALN